MAWERTLITIPFERNDRIHPVSPLDSATITIAGKTVKIRYSRPFMRGRVIWGTLVPFDSVWRTGANAVTSLWTDGEITIGGTAIPRGSYSLYSIPSERGLLLVVNRQVPGPTPEYQPALDIARISMTPLTPSAPIDPLRIWLTASSRTSCTLQLGWDTRAYSTIIKLR
jgi:hypothetical protein